MGSFKSLESGVYLFSKFTGEALIFEAFVICALCACYTAFWVLRKRRLGVIQSEVPSGVVKTYLNELIVDAEQLRAQLFGLLAATAARLEPASAIVPALSASTANTGALDPELAKKVALLESKMTEQSKAMDGLVAEKTKIEKELAAARAAGATATAGADPMVPKLQEKVSQLEGRLAEYSVIEDDLANLKRLQQENAQLRANLAGSGASAPPAAEAPAVAQKAAAAPPAPAAESPADALLGIGTGDPGFEGLVDQVEQSLEAAPAATATPAAAPAAAAATPAGSTSDAPAATLSKSDEDLVAEFEKMLNS